MVTSVDEGSKDDALLAIQKFTEAFAIVVYLKLILLSDFQPINHQLWKVIVGAFLAFRDLFTV